MLCSIDLESLPENGITAQATAALVPLNIEYPKLS